MLVAETKVTYDGPVRKEIEPGLDGCLYAMLQFPLLSESHSKSLKGFEETELIRIVCQKET